MQDAKQSDATEPVAKPDRSAPLPNADRRRLVRDETKRKTRKMRITDWASI